MKRLELNVTARNEKGKGANRRLRSQGEIPAVLYGGKEEKMLTVNFRDFIKLLNNPDGTNIIIDLKDKSFKGMAVIKEIQRDPVKREPLHVDFYEIAMDKPLRIPVSIHLTGTAHGVREGGILEQNLWEIEIEALPSNLPSHIDVDISGLGIGDSIHVKDVAIEDETLKVLVDKEELIAHVAAPRLLEAEEEEEEEVMAEPEVITAKKEEEEEE
ncbi:MAG TPA: 50S ribosomal protein L25 [Candidatus Mcinerneyibacteriales bacterium]|nr:50S ribosomal protein L25 [Candidatus Mcinerneyibacteriales bacterium]HPE19761.1 50S ribosomal protein L25 [Candidatus Mcinerneyibacteriales bacterium]HPQ88719.1 50S ribosomal protein L25 [Candidatus Mcinerneyibacteriales bacterium]